MIMDLSQRLHRLRERQVAYERDTFAGANLLVDRVHEAVADLLNALGQYQIAQIHRNPAAAQFALEAAATHLKTGEILCCSAERNIARQRRQEPRVR